MINQTEKTKENKTATHSGASSGTGGGDVKREKNKRRIKQGRFSKRDSKKKPEFEQKIISIRRVTRVVAGGRRFSFSVAMVLGDKKGSVGVGTGKASDTALAIEKAIRDAKKKMVKINLTKEMMIPHETSGKYCASKVIIMPTPGRGFAAGSSARTILESAGIKDVTAKILSRSKNKLNNARATIKALAELK